MESAFSSVPECELLEDRGCFAFFSVSLALITCTVGRTNCKNVDEVHRKLVMASSLTVAGMTLSCLGSS